VPKSAQDLVATLVRSFFAQPGPAEGAADFAFTALLLLLGGGLLWLELVVRSSLIYLFVFVGVAPLACAAVMWPRLEGVLRQVLLAGLALVVSKLVVVVALAMGFAVLSLGRGLAGLVGGAFLVLIAALMPFATARVLPLAAEELSALHQGRLRIWGARAVGTTQQVVAAAVAMASGVGPLAGAVLGVAPPMGSAVAGGPPATGPGGGAAGAPEGRPRGGPGGTPRVAAAAGGQPPTGAEAPRGGGPPTPMPGPGPRDVETEPPAPAPGPAPWGPSGPTPPEAP